MKRFAIGIPMIALMALLFVGCTTPHSEVHFKPFPTPSPESKPFHPTNPVVQEALAIIDTVLRRNGFALTQTFPNDRQSDLGWSISTTYTRKEEEAKVYSTGHKQPISGFETDNGSVEIYVIFSNVTRWFVKMPVKITSVRDEIAEALGRRFGKDKVVVSDNKESFELNW